MSRALATVVTEDFVPGALVTFHSFQHHNPRFDGDFLVIHDGLSEKSKDAFRTCFDRIHFESIGEDLRTRIDSVIETHPHLVPQKAQFYALEALRPRSYDKLLFCDADLLFRGDISDIWELPQPLICCPDRPAYLGKGRELQTYAITDPGPDALTDTFNSGFMLIDGALLSDSEFKSLLALLNPDLWENDATSHTDQRIFNLWAAGRQHLLGAEFNYLLGHPRVMREHAGISAGDARVLHFNVSAKPWQPAQLVQLDSVDPVLLKATQWWNEAFAASLQTRFLRGKIQSPLT